MITFFLKNDYLKKTATQFVGAFVLLFIFHASSQTAEPVWHIKNGQSELYLGGVLHTLPAGVDIPPAFEFAYQRSSRVIVETLETKNPIIRSYEQWRSSQIMYYPLRKPLRKFLGQNTREQLIELGERINYPFDELAYRKNALLGLVVESHLIDTPDPGADGIYIERAKQDGKTVGRLEWGLDNIRAFTHLNRIDPEIYIRQLLNELPNVENNHRKALNAWYRGQPIFTDGYVDEYVQKYPESREIIIDFFRALNDKRNRAWMPKIEKWLKPSVQEIPFILVGNMHLWGDSGLLQLLRNKGFSITQLDVRRQNLTRMLGR